MTEATVITSTTKATAKAKKPSEVAIKDQPGEFAWINKNELFVDETYQRKHSERKINRLAAKWSWQACGVLCVALRPDCKWFIFDGWHRKRAADLRDDITKLPCMVFEIDTPREEAQGFLTTNLERKPMTMVERYNALLMTDDHGAHVVKELVGISGRKVSSGGSKGSTNQFGAVGCMLRCVQTDEPALRRVWPIIVDACEGERITEPLIVGIWYLERHLAPDVSLSQRRWRDRIVDIGASELFKSMTAAANYLGQHMNEKAAGLGVVRAVNNGLRNKLEHTIQE